MAMELALKDTQIALTVSKDIFGHSFNEALVHQVVTAYRAGARQGTRAQKTRAQVTGSNKKPWRQKGTGRARSGSVKSPIWRSGGVTFASRPQDHSQKINKKMYRGALKSILSELVRQNRLIVIEKLSIEQPKTKLFLQKLKDMSLDSILLITDKMDNNVFLATRNLHNVDICESIHINPISLIIFNKIVVTAGAIRQIEEMLA